MSDYHPGLPPPWITVGTTVAYTDAKGVKHAASVTYIHAPGVVDLLVDQGPAAYHAAAIHKLFDDEPVNTPSRWRRAPPP